MKDKLDLATSYLFLNMAIKVLELDKQLILNGAFKIKEPYITLINSLISKAIVQRRYFKKSMNENKVHVNFLYREGDFSYYEFIINKSKTVKCYFNPIIKKEVKKIIDELISSNHQHS